ncbi:tRNA modification GTPase TrmE [Sporocytophaga myxococcoides]|uniref:tRNA modification GTPase MnmE n=1 Tax=Sporocytophaga myxococcoides TaxID=153721 RepID=A0A098LIK4_9BACT|nr:tRNA uridine-5-carboxymethylaminomethyl(34) synthesis GTPase MnmE [Sporocytophaga myxococcoides]GAL86816.1 tRNA modification GTPase TrmE [Sporocytophaga myxococcoides]
MEPHSRNIESEDTIAALATASGVGAIAVIRISGKDAIPVTQKIFKGKDLATAASHTIHFGTIRDGDKILDEVVVSLFKGPNSFTREDVIEISCHGSEYIVKQLLQLLIRNGVRLAKPGEFTKRAFLNGRFDLAQAEAIADLIYSETEAAHQAAMNQMRGGFSLEIKKLREQLINFASLIELELDFSEEDVEFADRSQLKSLIYEIKRVIDHLISSFDVGNVIKNGVPTVIAGKPNAGKSTLLNVLLNEERAIVSEIPGTTRDFIEDEMVLEGIRFRFIDTAGLRDSSDKIESIGIERTKQKMKQASLIIYLFDVNSTSEKELKENLLELKSYNIPLVVVGNKIDKDKSNIIEFRNFDGIIFISAAMKVGIEELKNNLVEMVNFANFKTGNVIVTNVRHYESLIKSRDALKAALEALDDGISGELLAQDIRSSLIYLGEITGEITTDDLLGNIFSKFCIGK